MPKETKTRYTVSTPNPKTRLSLGKWQDGGEGGPFGYDGISMQAENNLFADITKDTLVQSRGSVHVHAKKYMQSASSGITITSGAEATFATTGVTTIVAGAGQGASFAIDHGADLALASYNGLDLHYRTEEIQNGLFEFFLGRYKDDKDGGLLADLNLLKPERKFKPHAGLLDKLPLAALRGGAVTARDDKPFEGGFAGAANASWKELVGTSTCAALEGMEGVCRKLTEKGKLDEDGAKSALEFGYSAYFARHDPYACIDPSIDPPLNPYLAQARNFQIALMNAMATARRTVDVCAKIGKALSDNAITKKVQDCYGLIEAVAKNAKFFSNPKFWIDAQRISAQLEDERGALRAPYKKFREKVQGPKKADPAVLRSTSSRFDLSLGAVLELETNAGKVCSTPVSGFAEVVLSADPPTNAGAVAITWPEGSASVAYTAGEAPSAIRERVLAALPAARFSGSRVHYTVSIDSPEGVSRAAPRVEPALASAADVLALFDRAALAEVVKAEVKDGVLVFTSKDEGPGAFVALTRPGDSEASLTFEGDHEGKVDLDRIPRADPSQKLQDFAAIAKDKRMPADLANLFRPIANHYAAVEKGVEEVVDTVKATLKVAGISIPDSDGSLGLMAKKGISLGTPDRIVGAASKGIVLVADGSDGAPNRGKYVPFEDTLNQVTGAKFGWKTEKSKPKSLGVRAFSDSTIDLVARETVHIAALGRGDADDVAERVGKGVGTVSVLASDGVEVAAERTAALAARKGEAQVLGKLVTIGQTTGDHARRFGVRSDPGKQTPTARIVAHSDDETVIVAGDFMIRIARSRELEDGPRSDADVAELGRHLSTLERKLGAARKKVAADPTDLDAPVAVAALEAAKGQLEAKRAGAKQLAKSKGAVGVTIGTRDALVKGHAFKKSSPAVVLEEKKITVTSSLDDADRDSATTMTIEDGQFVVRRNQGALKEQFGLSKKGGFAAVDQQGKDMRLHDGNFRAHVEEFVVNGTRIQLG